MFLNPKFLLAAKPTPFLHLLERELENIGRVSSIDLTSPPFRDQGACVAFVSLAKPDILIHIHLQCEEALKAQIPIALQHGLIGTDAIFIHLSDTNLYAGNKGDLYTEEDVPDLQDLKALQVAKAHQELIEEFVHTVVIRSGRILGSTSSCQLKKFINSSLGRRHLTLNPGNRTSLISERQATKLLTHIIKKAVADKNVAGIFNLACIGTPSEFEWQTLALQTARKVRPDLVWPMTAMRRSYVKEENVGLDCTKFQFATGMILPDWQDAVVEATVNQVGLLGR
ncbi:MAG: sugar nucleotide-binding protein [Burkholderiales bacterium]|nr:sugar nucleotide-binding protein [Burkholderiales bacterium]